MVRRVALSLGFVLLFLGGWAVGARLTSVESIAPVKPGTPTVSEKAPTTPGESLENLLARVGSAKPSEFAALYREMSASGVANLDLLTARRTLLRRWVLEDPGQINWTSGAPEPFYTSESLSELAGVWLQTDPSGLFAWMEGLDGHHGHMVRKHLALTAPEPFLAHTEGMGKGPPEWDKEIATALITIADEDPTRAITLFQAMGLSESIKGIRVDPGSTSWNDTDDLPSELAALLSQTDPDAAIAFARSLKTPEARKNAFTATLAAITAQSLEAGEERMQELLDETGVTASSLVYPIAGRDLAKAMQWVERHEDPDDAPITLASLSAKVRDLETLRKLSGQIQNETVRDAFHLMVFEEWSRRPADLGVRWALEAPAAMRDEALKMLAHAFGADQYDEAMNASESITDPAARTLFQERLHLGLAASDPERALAFAAASGKPALRDAMLRKALDDHSDNAEYSIGELLSWAGEGELDRVPEQVIRSLGSRYFEESPEAALSWIESRPPRQKNSMLRSLAVSAARENLEAGLGMTNRIKDSAERHRAVRSIASDLSETDPARAFHLLSGLDRIPVDSLERPLKNWARRDPTAARAALASATQLSPTERARLETWIYARE